MAYSYDRAHLTTVDGVMPGDPMRFAAETNFANSAQFAELLKKGWTVRYDKTTGQGTATRGEITFEFAESTNDPAVLVTLKSVVKFKTDPKDAKNTLNSLYAVLSKI